ncbi:MAG: hypothetical protein H0Z39_07640 [Peptococcaceae bacterium]|nr:hypothetical protein [Peptococcaceae bacterium]
MAIVLKLNSTKVITLILFITLVQSLRYNPGDPGEPALIKKLRKMFQ